MIFYDKKRTIVALFISAVAIGLFIFVGVPYIYDWQNKKIDQFDNLNIQQVNDMIKISLLPKGDISGIIVQQVNLKQESIIFSFTGSNDKLKSSYIFPINGLHGYEICYENGLNLQCFGKTK